MSDRQCTISGFVIVKASILLTEKLAQRNQQAGCEMKAVLRVCEWR